LDYDPLDTVAQDERGNAIATSRSVRLSMKGCSMSAEARLREKLMVALEPTRLDIVNESELHAGHRSSPNTGESHFRILIVSPRFAGVSRVGRHRLVNEAIADELSGRIHALALSTYAPGESLG
jgi:BolA protein